MTKIIAVVFLLIAASQASAQHMHSQGDMPKEVGQSAFAALAEIVEKELVIKPQLVGKLPGGLKIRSLEIKPEKVKVFSPASDEMDKLISLTTTPIYLNNIYENTTIYCKIIALPAVQPKEKRWPDVMVVITVGR